jgi:hypothetical protein
MSYDFSVSIDAGAGLIDIGFEHNMTSNVSGMWALAMGTPMRELRNMKCSECIPYLERGIKAMKAHPEVYSAMNPANGWGSSESALETLETLLGWCREAPKGYLKIYS